MSTPYFPSVGQPIGVPTTGVQPSNGTRQVNSGQTTGTSFDAVLRQQMSPTGTLKLSAHAEARLQQRGVSLSQGDWSKVESAVNAARQKGSKDAYVVYGQVGLVVNVPNSTVVTALQHGPQTVVTNIDSVVVV